MKRLRVRRVKGSNFGRFGDRSIDLRESDFVVVHGLNETGKSTLAALISLVLAGRPDLERELLRWVNDGMTPKHDKESIGGSIVGEFDDQEFTITRNVGVRTASGGVRPKSLDPSPDVSLATNSLTEEQWKLQTSLSTGDEYAMRHRITDREGDIDITSLIESLAAGVTAGMPPREVINQLREEAGNYAPELGKGKQEAASARANRVLIEAKGRKTSAEKAQASLQKLEEDLSDLRRRIETMDARRKQLHSEAGDIDVAIQVHGYRTELDDLRSELDQLENVPDEWTPAMQKTSEVESLLNEVATAEASLGAISDEIHQRAMILGVEPRALDQLSIEPDTLLRVAEIRADISRWKSDIEESDATIQSARTKKEDVGRRLEEYASSLRLSIEELRHLSLHPLSDSSISDALGDWRRASTVLNDAILNQKHPIESGSIQESQIGKSSITRLAVLATFVIASTAFSSLVNSWIALGVAALGTISLALAIRRFDLPKGREDRGSIIVSGESIERLRDQEARAADTARGLFHELGIHEELTLEGCLSLRDARAACKSVLEELSEAEQQEADAKAKSIRLNSQINGHINQLTNIANSCGLAHYSDRLSSEHVVTLSQLILDRNRRNGLLETVSQAKSGIESLRNNTPLPDLPAKALLERFQFLVRLYHERQQLERKIEAKTFQISTAIKPRPSVNDLLDQPGVDLHSLNERKRSVGFEIEEIDRQIAGANEAVGASRSAIADLEETADLPTILFQIDNAESELSEAVQSAIALRAAARIVEEVKAEVEQRNQPSIILAASRIVSAVTSGEWARLIFDDEQQVLKVVYRDGTTRAAHSLSAGATDLLRLAIRIAVADEHAQRHGVALPLLCDDPSGDIDSERTPRIIETLVHASHSRQVVLFTHDERTVDLALKAGAVAVDLGAH